MSIADAFDHFPSLTTDRLLLRQLQPTDANACFVFKSDFDVTKHYGQEPHQTVDNTRAWIQRLQDAYERHEVIFWCLTLKGEDTVIGSCTLWNFSPEYYCAELGYELHPAYWRKGLMTEALAAVVACGFTQLGLHRIEATTLAENTSSRKLLLRLGFTLEGQLRQRQFFRGQFKDEVYFGLLKTEWLRFAKE